MYLPALFRKINPKIRGEFCSAAVTCSPLLNVDFDRWADVFQRASKTALTDMVKSGRRAEVAVSPRRKTMLRTRFLRVLRAFAVKVQPRIHREAAKSAKISRRKILRPAKSFRVSSIDNTDLCSMVMQRVLANPLPNDH